jgi:hypothetical protein
MFRDISAPLIEAAGLRPGRRQDRADPRSVDQRLRRGRADRLRPFGLITRAENANELQGVIAHELGHVVGGHVIRKGEGIEQATSISILSLLLGVAAMAAGAGEAGAAIMGMGQQAAMSASSPSTGSRRAAPMRRALLPDQGRRQRAGQAWPSSRSSRTWRFATPFRRTMAMRAPIRSTRSGSPLSRMSTRPTPPGTGRRLPSWRRGSSA